MWYRPWRAYGGRRDGRALTCGTRKRSPGFPCSACAAYPRQCPGCNACQGKVFHAPKGKACPLYACPVSKHHLVNCGACPELPCALWHATRDPALSDEGFQASIQARVERLRQL